MPTDVVDNPSSLRKKRGSDQLIKNFDHCLYESERKVFDYLVQSLPDTSDIVVFPNYELFDRSKEAYVECDAIVVTKTFIGVVDLKDWVGSIVVEEPKWRRGNALIDSPHVVNNRKCKVLKSYVQHVLSHVSEFNLPYVQSIIALTSNDAHVEGATTAKQTSTTQGSVTLDGMEELSRYLKQRLHEKSATRQLTDSQFHKLVSQLDHDKQSMTVDYADQISGYRIREDRGSTPNYITYIAERNPKLDNRLYRLRVFGKLNKDPSIREKQVRSIKAVTALPYHPRIRMIQEHPNERQLIVEVSDWTDTRSLENVIAEQGRLDWQRAAVVVKDIAEALNHIHTSSLGLIHRNVQPQSVLMSTDGHAQLADFDLAYDPSSDHTVLGKNEDERLFKHFTAPEVFVGAADYCSDIYSLGAVFFYALTGKEVRENTQIISAIKDALDGSAEGRQIHAIIELISAMLKSERNSRPEAKDVIKIINEMTEKPAEGGGGGSDSGKEETAYTSRQRIAEGATAEIFCVDNHGEVFIQKVFKADFPREDALRERDTLRAVGKRSLAILFPRVRHFSEIAGHRWCLATDLVPGRCLRDLIKNGERPSIERFSNVARVLLEALATLHQPCDGDPEIIHNDINPNNILIDERSGAIGLIDFGCATSAGVISLRGTQGYVDPTLVSRGEMNACPRGDLFALATTLGQWLTGSDDPFSATIVDDDRMQRLLVWLARVVNEAGPRYETAMTMLEGLDEALSAPDTTKTVTAAIPDQFPSAVQVVTQVASPASGSSTNDFVTYLNSLHNASAGNANALAEYQATNKYFSGIYEPIAIAEDIFKRLTADTEVVIVLSGHAGDGKSTIALDVLKKIRGLPIHETLKESPKPLQRETFNGKKISILKDMSEHPVDDRIRKFSEALEAGSGSWLLVSNTGPLLNTLNKINTGIEGDILKLLDRPIINALSDESHRINGFDKAIYVANLTKIDNVETAVKVLDRISHHPSWEKCAGCASQELCPIRGNITALQTAPFSSQRVAWMYRLLTSYERRLTMRQMTAHLAFSITGGLDCTNMAAFIDQYGASAVSRKYLFSELFFGYTDTKRYAATSNLYCVEQLQTYTLQGRTRPLVETRLLSDACNEYAPLSPSLSPIFEQWKSRGIIAKGAKEGADARAALRRLLFMFGSEKDTTWWKSFVEDFSGSERLRDWEQWRTANGLPQQKALRRLLVREVMAVLREYCTGFTAVPSANEMLYVTLRRDDMETTQPVQVVIGKYEEGQFDIVYDQYEQMPRLVFLPSGGAVFMRLALPLLDFVSRRSTGDFGQNLDPIYVNQLDLFCSQLVANCRLDEEYIYLLSVGVTGKQEIKRVSIENGTMEIN